MHVLHLLGLPLSLFELRSRVFKALRFPSCGGMCPADMQVQAEHLFKFQR